MTRRHLLSLSITIAFFALSTFSRADNAPATPTTPLLQGIGIDQKLGAQVPPDIAFNDDDGRRVTLADLESRANGKPIIVALVYLRCPSLCTVVLNDTLNAIRVVPQNLGEQYNVWTISFDPKEGPSLASEKKNGYVASYVRTRPHVNTAAAGWHFLTGDALNIARFTSAVGFRYKWDEGTQQYIHPAGILILTPEGKIARYFFGVDYDPTDLRLSLVEASNGKIGSLTDKLLLFCYHYDPSTGKYGLVIARTLQVGAAITLISLGLGFYLLWRIDRRRTKAGLALAASLAHPGGAG